MLRFLLVLAISVNLIFCSNAQAGPMKWALRGGAALCLKSSSCSGAVARGVGKGAMLGGEFLLKRYAPSAVQRCLSSPICLEYAGKLSLGGAVASAAWDHLDDWMKENDTPAKEPLSPMFGHNSGHMPEDPDDPFGENKNDEKPVLGKKLDFIFGKATGRPHNLQRSQSMLAQLNRVGIQDTPASREYIEKILVDAFNDPASTVSSSADGFVTKESLVMGPGGGVKLESVWNGKQLISAIIKGTMK
jgi:hypothetical protein